MLARLTAFKVSKRSVYSALLLASAFGGFHCGASHPGEDSASADLTAGPPSLPLGYARESASEKQSTLASWVVEDEYCGAVAGETAVDPGDDVTGWPVAQDNDGYPAVRPLAAAAAAKASPGDYLRPSCNRRLDVKIDALSIALGMATLPLSFDHDSDEQVQGRAKIVHPFGAVATVVFQTKYPATSPPTSSRGSQPYTGFLAPDRTSAGVVRLAPGAGHRGGQPGTEDSFVPGIAMKLLVDGQASVNTFGINRADGQGADMNYFRNALSNFTPPDLPRSLFNKIGVALFRAVKLDNNQIPVDNLARTDATGSTIDRPNFPYRLTYQPSPEITAKYQALLTKHGADTDFRSLLRQMPAGTVLYKVLATKEPCDTPEEIGRVVLTSPLVASRRGDFQLFFRHPRGVRFDDRSFSFEDTNVPRDLLTGEALCR